MCYKALLETWLALLAAVVNISKRSASNCCELPICLLITVLASLSFVGSTVVLYDIPKCYTQRACCVTAGAALGIAA